MLRGKSLADFINIFSLNNVLKKWYNFKVFYG